MTVKKVGLIRVISEVNPEKLESRLELDKEVNR